MMSFKQQLAADVGAVFLNPLEFAEKMRIDNRMMTAVLDDNELVDRKSAISSDKAWDGVFKTEKLLFVSAADFGPRPRIGRLLNIEGRDYQVYHVTDEGGIYAIYLGANLSR